MQNFKLTDGFAIDDKWEEEPQSCDANILLLKSYL